MSRSMFRVAIGDWSGDGHGKNKYFKCSSALPIAEVREAYFAAKAKLPKTVWPEKVCCEYEDSVVSEDVQATVVSLGGPEMVEFGDGYVRFMLDLTIWFINHGNPAADVKVEDEDVKDTLHFYGSDDKGRHISFIGYGMFHGD